MISKIESLIDDLKWEMKDREKNYIPAGDIERVILKLEGIVASERQGNIELSANRCECHERDSSYVCSYCYSKGLRGSMQQ